MKRKISIIILSIVCAALCAFGLAACGEKPNAHVHDYQWVNNGDGTHRQHCQNDGCDAPDINVGNHDFTNGDCVCGAKYVHTHTFNKQVAESAYLASEATCERKATYYYSCECGEKGAETFEYGELAEHTFTQEKAESTYLKTQATCLSKAVYYKSCAKCGAKGEQTFESGDYGDHSYGEWDTEKQVTCTEDGLRFRVCSVCDDRDEEIVKTNGHTVNVWTYKDLSSHEGECSVCHENITAEHGWDDNSCEVCNYTVDGTRGLYYELSENEEYYVCAGMGDSSETNIVIPSYYNGLPVYEVKITYFYVESLVISDGIKTVRGYKSFDTSLKCLTIGKDVEEIYDGGFQYCVNLSEIHFNAIDCTSYAKIDSELQPQYAFSWAGSACGEVTLYIGPDVKVINEQIFSTGGNWGFADTEIVYNPALKSVVFDENCELTTVGASAFRQQTALTSITLPDSVTSIGNSAFSYCRALEEINIPDGITKIEDNTFSYCKALTDITIPDGVTSIGSDAFYGCSSLASVSIPDGVTALDERVFFGCENLTDVTIPVSVTDVDMYAFFNCSRLSNIHYKGTVEDWCKLSTVYGIMNHGVNDIKLYINGKDVTQGLVIPDSVTSVNDYAFSNCRIESATVPAIAIPSIEKAYLKTLVITSGESIYERAFANCTALTNVTISANITEIGFAAFSSCPIETATIPAWAISAIKNDKLQTVVINGGDAIESGAFANCTSLASVKIADSIMSIGNQTFSGCSSLTSITIPDSVTVMGYSVFADCAKLRNVKLGNGISGIDRMTFKNCVELDGINLPYGLESIGEESFYGCIGLSAITIPDSVTNIGSDAFFGCTGLTSVVIPDSVTVIPDRMFCNCSNLSNVVFPDSLTNIGYWAFEGTKIIEVENGVYYVNNWAVNVSYGKTSITLREGTVGISGYALRYNGSSLQNISLPDSLIIVPDSTFYDCNKLTYNLYHYAYYLGNETNPYVILMKATSKDIGVCTIHDDTKLIYSGAFYGCGNLTSITIPDGVVSIGGSAFCDCSGLKNITIPDSVTSIGNYALSGCSLLTNITLPDNLTRIGEKTFSFSGITSITIPDSVNYIGNGVFNNCANLVSITTQNNSRYHSVNNCLIDTKTKTLISGCGSSVIPNDGSVTRIADYAFYGCSGLTEITIPDSVTSIGDYAFFGCGLTGLTIPKTVTSIGEHAFSDCNGLTSVVIQGNLSVKNGYLFGNCDNLKSVTVGKEVTDLNAQLFNTCPKLEIITVEEGNSVYHSVDNCLIETKTKTLVLGGNASVIPTDGSVTVIGRYAFSGCGEMTQITIPDSVTLINYYAFGSCSGLVNVSFGNGVTEINSNAFERCTALESIVLPENVLSIGQYVFSECSALKSITILGSQTRFSADAFRGCCVTSVSVAEDNNYYHCTDEYLVRTIDNKLIIGCNISTVTIGEEVSIIGERAFTDCTELTKVTIANTVTKIESWAFINCSNLIEIVYEGTVDEWNAITKNYGWNLYIGNYTIHCTDGDIT